LTFVVIHDNNTISGEIRDGTCTHPKNAAYFMD